MTLMTTNIGDTGDDDPDGARRSSSQVTGGARVVAGVQHVSVANSQQTFVIGPDATLARHWLVVRTVPPARTTHISHVFTPLA